MKKLFLILLTTLVALGSQQGYLENKFRIGQSFESTGDWENAVKIYEDIYKSDSTRSIFYESLLRAYEQLKKYDDAKRIVKARIRLFPRDLNLHSQLAKIHTRAGELDDALKIWQSLIDSNPGNTNVYYIVANAMIEVRLFENALKVYEQGRKNLNIPYIFATDIGYLHSILMNYAEATKEYLLLLKQSPEQLNFIQSRISIYTSKLDGLKSATLIVENAYKKEPKDPVLNRLLAWLYMEGKDYEKAFEVYKILDEITSSGGNEIYNFAERARRERAYSTASKAFQEVLVKYPKSRNIAAVKFGYAQTLEASTEIKDTLKIFLEKLLPDQQYYYTTSLKLDYEKIIEIYNQIINEYPNSEFAARALLQNGNLYFYKFSDYEKSNALITEIEIKYKNYGNIYSEAVLLKSQILIALDSLNTAEDKLLWLSNYPGANAEQKEKGRFYLAKIAFYKQNFKECVSILMELLKNPFSDIVNDAISLQTMVQDNLDNEKNLRFFSEAQLLKTQKKFDYAREKLQEVIKTPNELAADAILEIGNIFTLSNQYDSSIIWYNELIKRFPDHLNSDAALFKIATIYHYGLRNKENAEESYKKLLEKFPQSIYVSTVRKRIRELRGEVL